MKEPERELTEADLPGLQEDVTRLQQEFDDAVVVKHNLDSEVKSCSERLKAATELLHRSVMIIISPGSVKARKSFCRIRDGDGDGDGDDDHDHDGDDQYRSRAGVGRR